MTDPLRAALEDFMGWLFRDGGLEPPRREYDDVEQRLRGLLIAGLMNHPAADTARPDAVPQPFAMARLGLYEPPTAEARPGLADVRQRVSDLQARWMLSEGDLADARCGAYDDVLDIIDHALTEKRP